MPTYEYRCPEGHLFERFQKMTDTAGATCPTCGRPGERQISGGAGLVFKGSGFYITDYGKDGKGPRKPEKEHSGESGTDASSAKGKDKGESKGKDKGSSSSSSDSGGSSPTSAPKPSSE